MKYLKVGGKPIHSAYLVGIKGVGMTALAQVLASMGIHVSGADTKEEFFTDHVLRKLGIPFAEGFSKNNVPREADIYISSAAYWRRGRKNDHPEISEIRRMGKRIYIYPEILGMLFDNFYGIAVAGSHGKTTTTALLGHVLRASKLDPTVIVGSQSFNFKSNAALGARSTKTKNILVAEADEYRAAFLQYRPHIAVVLNVDYDHPDFFKNEKTYISAFETFISRLPKNGLLVFCGDDMNTRYAARKAKCRVTTYGMDNTNDLYCRNIRQRGLSQSFVAVSRIKQSHFTIPLSGAHNVLNALAVIAVARVLKISDAQIRKAFLSFRGTKRRMEIVGKRHGALIIDDYAHHPSEIKATLSALRAAFPAKKIIAAFQPHTFSRTKKFLKEFAKSFTSADEVIIFEVYGSAREKENTVSAQNIVRIMRHNNARYEKNMQKAEQSIIKTLDKNSVLVTMGAGDIWMLSERIAR